MMNRTKFYGLALLLLLMAVSHASAQVDAAPADTAQSKISSEARALIIKGRALLAAGQLRESIEIFNQLLRLDPRNVSAYNNISYAYGVLGQHPEAIEAARKALEIQPDNGYAYGRFAYSYNEMHRYEEANKAARRAIEINPQDFGAYFNLGTSYNGMKQYKEAVAVFMKAIQLKADIYYPYDGLGYAYLNSGQYGKSVEWYQKAILLKPNAGSYNNMGYAYLRLGRHTDAVEALKQALRLDPKYRKAYENLGLAYFQQARYEEAAEALKQAVRIPPDSEVGVYMLLGVSTTKLNRHKDAIDAFTQAIRLKPQESEAFRSRSYAHLYLAHGDAAATDARRYLDLSGGANTHTPYMLIVAYLGYRQAGRDADANRVLDEAIEKAGDAAAAWPYPIIRYLRREITTQELLALADDGNKKTEAHAHIGMNLSLSGNHEEALVHLGWVRENGNKNFTEYSLALAEIDRIKDKAKNSIQR